MADQVPHPRATARRAVPSGALVGAVGVAVFAMTFCAVLLVGRDLVGSAALTLPIAVTGAAAVALVAAFGVGSTIDSPGGRVRAGRVVMAVTPLAAAVALFAYAADPGTTVGRALGVGDGGVVDARGPRAQRTIDVGSTPVTPRRVPPAPPAAVPAGERPAAPGTVVRPDAPANPVAPAVPGTPGQGNVAGPVAPPVVAPADPGDRPGAPVPARPVSRPAARQLPESPDPVERDAARPAGTSPTRVAPSGTTGITPTTVESPKLVTRTASSVEPRDTTPQRTKAARPAPRRAPAKATAARSKAKPRAAACHRATGKGRPAACRKR